MEPIVMKNEAIQDEAILSKCRDELNKLFNKVDGFPIEKLGDKGKFISAKLYNSYRLKATTDSITRQFVWEYDRRLSRSRPDNYRALESFGGLWDIMPDKLSKDFDIRLEGTWKIGTCPECNGDGNVDCVNCETSGTVTCRNCDGQGTIEVEKEVRCDMDYDHYLKTHRLPEHIITKLCGYTEAFYWNNTHYWRDTFSKKRIECPACKGAGILTKTIEVNCPNCNGSGDVECPYCKGKGEIECKTCHGTGEVPSECHLEQKIENKDSYFSIVSDDFPDITNDKGTNILKEKFQFSEDTVLFDYTEESGLVSFERLPEIQSYKPEQIKDMYNEIQQPFAGEQTKVRRQRLQLLKCARMIEYKFSYEGDEYAVYFNPKTFELYEIPSKSIMLRYIKKYDAIGENAKNKGNWSKAFQNYAMAFGMKTSKKGNTNFAGSEEYIQAMDRARDRAGLLWFVSLILGFVAVTCHTIFKGDGVMFADADGWFFTIIYGIFALTGLYICRLVMKGMAIKIAGGKLLLFAIGLLQGGTFGFKDYWSLLNTVEDKTSLSYELSCMCPPGVCFVLVTMFILWMFTSFSLNSKSSSIQERLKNIKASFKKAQKNGTITKLATGYKNSKSFTLLVLGISLVGIVATYGSTHWFASADKRMESVKLDIDSALDRREKLLDVDEAEKTKIIWHCEKLIREKYYPAYVAYADLLATGKAYMQNNPQRAKEILQEACDANFGEALALMGKWYEEGICVEKNPVKAGEYYRKAAQAGYTKATEDSARLGF